MTEAVGATGLEKAEGTLENGDWLHFDPRLPRHPVWSDLESPAAGA